MAYLHRQITRCAHNENKASTKNAQWLLKGRLTADRTGVLNIAASLKAACVHLHDYDWRNQTLHCASSLRADTEVGAYIYWELKVIEATIHVWVAETVGRAHGAVRAKVHERAGAAFIICGAFALSKSDVRALRWYSQ